MNLDQREKEGEKQTFDFSFLLKVAAKYLFGFISIKHGTNFRKIRCIVSFKKNRKETMAFQPIVFCPLNQLTFRDS